MYENEIQKREEENQKEITSKTDIGWGHQIRSYVLQPYQLVKDLRNKAENTNPSSVLDGNIDQFIEEGIKSFLATYTRPVRLRVQVPDERCYRDGW